jgi:hypothetical protein
VSAGVAPARHDPTDVRLVAAEVEIDVRGRWDALALSELLIPFHSFLVQRGGDRWVVYARSPGCHGEPLDAALAVIGEWRDERATEAAVRVDGQLQGDKR